MLENVRARVLRKLKRITPNLLHGTVAMIALMIALGWVGALPLNAQSPATRELLRRAFLDQDFAVKSFGPVRWLNGGSSYSTLEPSAGADKTNEIVRYDTATAQREILVSAQQIIPPTRKSQSRLRTMSFRVT